MQVHGPEHIHVAGNPPIPGIQAHPLALKGNDHVTRIHYHGPHIGHPHLVGVEHYNPAPNYEPSVTNVKVGHGDGHGDWA